MHFGLLFFVSIALQFYFPNNARTISSSSNS